MIVIFAILVLVPAFVFGADAPARVKIGTASITASTLSLWSAQEQGFFKKQALEAQIILIRGGPTLVASMISGDTPYAFTTGVSFLGAAAQGTDVKMLTSVSEKVSWKLMASRQIKTPQDLRGKRIGVSSIVGTTWLNSMLALEQLGLDPKRDNIVFLQTGDPVTMGHALESGRIDAAVLDPVTSRGLAAKGFPLLADLLKGNVVFPGLGLGVTRAYLDKNTATAEKVVTALMEGLAFVLQPANKAVVLKSLMKNMKMNDQAAAEEGYLDQIATLNRKPYPSIEGLRNAQRMMAQQNPKIGAVKIEEIADARFIKKLDESGFIDKLYAAPRR
jgi:NitT/TauT family transport system substrate-binding protein